MDNRNRCHEPCQGRPRCRSGTVEEKLYPASRLGIGLIVAGLALAFLSFVFGFLLALLGAALIVLGYFICRAA